MISSEIGFLILKPFRSNIQVLQNSKVFEIEKREYSVCKNALVILGLKEEIQAYFVAIQYISDKI